MGCCLSTSSAISCRAGAWRCATATRWCGLATDYCVLNSVLDALRLGFAVILLTDGIRPVEIQPGDGARAIATMLAAALIIVPATPGPESKALPLDGQDQG